MNCLSNRLSTRLTLAILGCVLLLGVAVRLYRLHGLPFDRHWYRQIETAAMARNFYEGSMNILYPQVDWGGDTPGYIESEFPVYQYFLAALYQLFGPDESLGRLLNIFFYILSYILLFVMTRKLYDDKVALLAVCFYSFLPLSCFYTRSIQPYALAALSTLAGVYFFWVWTENGRWAVLALSAAGTALAILIKPSNLYLGLPLLYLLYSRFGLAGLRKAAMWVYAVAVLTPAYLWYSHAFQLWETYGNTLFRAFLGRNFPAVTDDIWLTIAKSSLFELVQEIATPPGVLLLLLGVASKPPRSIYVLHWWTVGFVIAMLIAPVPHLHDYYQLPLVFPACVFMAQGLTQLWRGHVHYLNVAVALFLLAAFLAVQFIHDHQRPDVISACLFGASLLISGTLLLRRLVAFRMLATLSFALVIVASSSYLWLNMYPEMEWA